MLQTEPSFCIYADEDGFLENEKADLEIKSTSCEFTFAKRSVGLIVEDDDYDRLSEKKNMKNDEHVEPLSPKMYLATGFGIGGIGLKPTCFDENSDVEDYYKMMVSEHPCNPLFLRNYAQFLQSKGDLAGAEYYYLRATLEDPKDSEILMQYAKLVWELHHDKDTSLTYFERAARAAPEDCNVLAAYARFLWDIDEDYDGDDGLIQKTLEVEERPVHSNIDCATERNLEVCYMRMVNENARNSLVLRNYAHFLQKSKGDLEGAKEYYSRAMLVDPGDGEITSQYAQLVWELHHDLDKASCYFEQAVQAAPTDSHVLAAYAKFLWDVEDEGDRGRPKDKIQLPILQGAVTPA